MTTRLPICGYQHIERALISRGPEGRYLRCPRCEPDVPAHISCGGLPAERREGDALVGIPSRKDASPGSPHHFWQPLLDRLAEIAARLRAAAPLPTTHDPGEPASWTFEAKETR